VTARCTAAHAGLMLPVSSGPATDVCSALLCLPPLQMVNTASEAELCFILREYGEEKSWKAVARR
jgi:hypothetical protein